MRKEQCELCLDIYYDTDDDYPDFVSINETGRCRGCVEEFGLIIYPDQI